MCVGVCRGASPFPVRPCGRTRCSRYASGLRAPADVRLGRCPWNAVFRNPPRTVDFDRSSAVRVARLGGGWAVSPRGPRLASPAPPRVLSRGRPPPPPRLYGVGDGFSPSLGAVVRLLPRGGGGCLWGGFSKRGEAEAQARLSQSSPRFLSAAGSSVRWLSPRPPCVFFSDRCGDVALSRAGPKPRRTRDGHSWRMGPLFSLRPRAPLLSFPAWLAVCGKERGAEPGPTSLFRLLCPSGRRRGARGLSDAADTLRPPFPGCVSRAAPPRGGEGRPADAPRASAWARECVSLWSSGCSWSAPGRRSGARGRAGVVVPRSS